MLELGNGVQCAWSWRAKVAGSRGGNHLQASGAIGWNEDAPAGLHKAHSPQARDTHVGERGQRHRSESGAALADWQWALHISALLVTSAAPAGRPRSSAIRHSGR